MLSVQSRVVRQRVVYTVTGMVTTVIACCVWNLQVAGGSIKSLASCLALGSVLPGGLSLLGLAMTIWPAGKLVYAIRFCAVFAVAAIVFLMAVAGQITEVRGVLGLAIFLPASVLALGVARIVRSSRNQEAWKREWVTLVNASKAFEYPSKVPVTDDGCRRLFENLPYNPKLKVIVWPVNQGVLSFNCGNQPTEVIFGRLCAKVLLAWRSQGLPDTMVYRCVLADGSESLWIKAIVYKSDKGSHFEGKLDAYALVGMRFSRLGQMAQVTVGGRASVKFIRSQKPVNGWWHRSDYHHATKHYIDGVNKIARMLPCLAFLYVPGLINPKWEFTSLQGQRTNLLHMTGEGGEIEDDILIDAARAGGAPMLNLQGADADRLTEVVNVLRNDMVKALQLNR